MEDLHAADPHTAGPYRLVSRIGSGGMGVVYLAEDANGRQVALKLVRPELADDPVFRSRFRREVQAGQRVGGICTAKYLDADLDSEHPYLVTEYVEGGNLADYVASHGPLVGEQLIGLAVGLAEAIVAMHASGVIHRDLKPTNVLMAPAGPKVVDFGISHAADGTALTQTGVVVGSPSWMAPEQAQGRETIPAVDVFSWGATVAFAATGRFPFGEGRPDAVIYRVVHEEPDLSGVDPKLLPMVVAALNKDPAARPAPDKLLVDVVKTAMAGDVPPGGSVAMTTLVLDRTWVNEPPSPLPPKTRRPRQVAWIAASVVVIAAFVAGALYVAHANHGKNPVQRGTVAGSNGHSSITTSTSATTSTTSPPPLTPPAALADIPSCDGCQIIDMVTGLSSPSGPASLVAVQVPNTVSSPETPMRFYLIGNGHEVIWSAPSGDPVPAAVTDGVHFTVDKSGNALMPIVEGAHGGQMLIIRVTPEGINDFGTLTSGAFGTNTPTYLQPTPSGYDQIVVPVNNYQPDYADGTTTDNIYSWSANTDAYILTSCQVLNGQGAPGDTYAPTGGNC
jgi:serine/threonine protein kinase